MSLDGIDDLDRHVLYSLQRNARDTSANEIAERMGVSPSTVRNRINRLEDLGILRGYYADIDYEAAQFQLHTLLVCTAPVPEREALAQAALDVSGVVVVREVMKGHSNLHIEAVGTDRNDLQRISQELSALGLEIEDEDLIRDEHYHPYQGFHTGGE